MADTTRVAVVPGDGIGVDVTKASMAVLQSLQNHGLNIKINEYDYSADRYLATGVSLPPGGMEDLASHDAIFMGAFGDPRVPDMAHARDILLGARFELDLYINLRPVKCLHESLNPLKIHTAEAVDMLVYRENTEVLYTGIGGFAHKGTPQEVASNSMLYTRKGVQRILQAAFEGAARRRGLLVMVDKHNAVRHVGDLWMRVFTEMQERFPGVEARQLFVDAAAMQIIKNPSQFDVIVTSNMFGDILSDLASMLAGGLGLAPSANLNLKTGAGLFEPVHGSAPKYAGKDVANPMAAILTLALLLDHIHAKDEANAVRQAVIDALTEGKTTKDLGGPLGTAATGEWIAERAITFLN